MPNDSERASARVITVARAILELTERLDRRIADAAMDAAERLRLADELRDLVAVEPALLPTETEMPRASVTLGDMVRLALLSRGVEGALVADISGDIATRTGSAPPPSSLHATLSRMAAGGSISRLRAGLYVLGPRPEAKEVRRAAAPAHRRGPGRPTVADLVLEELARAHPRTLGVGAIRDAIQRNRRTTVQRTTISPLLARLERAGRVVHEGSAWGVSEEVAKAVQPGPSADDAASIRDLVLRTLECASPAALGVGAIGEAIGREEGRRLDRAAISSELSRLQTAGTVERIGTKWRIPERH